MGDNKATADQRCVERVILSEDDLTLKKLHSFDDLVMGVYPKATKVTDRMRQRLMINIFDE